MRVIPSEGPPENIRIYILRHKLTEKSQNVGKGNYLPYSMRQVRFCIYKILHLRSRIYRIVFARIYFTKSLSSHNRGRKSLYLSNNGEKQKLWRTWVLQTRVVNPKNLPLNPLIRPLQNYRRQFQTLSIFLITNLTKLSMLGTKLRVKDLVLIFSVNRTKIFC